jgi:AAA15 family ATPase/GTPase
MEKATREVMNLATGKMETREVLELKPTIIEQPYTEDYDYDLNTQRTYIDNLMESYEQAYINDLIALIEIQCKINNKSIVKQRDAVSSGMGEVIIIDLSDGHSFWLPTQYQYQCYKGYEDYSYDTMVSFISKWS